VKLSRCGFLLTAAVIVVFSLDAGGAENCKTQAESPVEGVYEYWRPFSNHSPFNTPIPKDAEVHPNSEKMLESLLDGTFRESDRGHLHVNIQEWSIPVYRVPQSGAQIKTIRCDSKHWSGFESVTLPVWAELKPDPEADAHMVVLDLANNTAWDFWSARWQDGQLRTRAANTVDLSGDGLVPEGGCRLVGFALLAGLITPEDIASGKIDHALVFAHEYLAPRHVWPANKSGRRMKRANSIPCGGVVQLDPAVDVNALDLTPVGKMIARALQRYGMYASDYADGLVIYAENPMGRAVNPWPALGLDNLSARNIPVQRMRVLMPGVTKQLADEGEKESGQGK